MEEKYFMENRVNLLHPESGRPCLGLVVKNPRGRTAGCPCGKTQQRRGNEEDKEQEENRFTMPGCTAVQARPPGSASREGIRIHNEAASCFLRNGQWIGIGSTWNDHGTPNSESLRARFVCQNRPRRLS